MMKVFISTGEVSGDIQGANLAEQLYSLSNNKIEITGFGGHAMREVGVSILSDMSTLSTMGIFESANPVFAFKKLGGFNLLKEFLDKNEIDLMILVDNQGVNLILANFCKKNNIKYVYYFPPHVGIWGAWNAKRLLSSERVITPFLFDYDVYAKYKCKTTYSGHPFADIDYSNDNLKELNIEDKEYTVGVLLGSRYQEIKSLAPVFIKSMLILNDMLSGNIRFVIPIAYPDYKNLIEDIFKSHKDMLKNITYTFLEGEDKENVYKYSDVLILSSGTASLLAACYGKPMVICYKISALTFFIGKLLYKVRFIGMPNILLNESVAPELLQKECNANAIVSYIIEYLTDKALYKKTSDNLIKIRHHLGDKKVTQRVAKEILDIVDN